MKALLTGSNGLLGQKLVPLLAAQFEEVVATSRGECRIGNLPPNVRYRVMDITNKQQVENIIGGERPDVVINAAAMTHVDQCETNQEMCWLMNVTAVGNLIEACETTDSFLLHVSTDFIFDGKAGPYAESAAPNPLSHYGKSKLASEKLLEESKLKWAIARTILVYGIVPDLQRSNIILWVKKSLEQGKPIQVVTDQWRTPTLAEDLAMGCLLIAEKQAEGIFNISGKDMLTPYEMAIKTARFFNLDLSLVSPTDGTKFQQAAKRPAKTGLIIDKAEQELGYQPHSFDEGLGLLAFQLTVAES